MKSRIQGKVLYQWQKKLSIWGTGFNASMEKLGGTTRSTLSTLFDPLLSPLTEVITKTNTLIGKLGVYAEKHKSVSQTASYGLGALAVGSAVYAATKLTRGAFSGAKVFKGIFGKGGSTAAGIAKGKAIEAATGVQPVFVTNWPNDGGIAALATATSSSGGAPSLLKNLSKKFMGSAVARLSAAAAVGYGAGTLINKYVIDGTKLGDAIGRDINLALAAFGNKTSKEALAAEGTVHIKIDSEQPSRIQKVQAQGMTIDVDTGIMIAGRG